MSTGEFGFLILFHIILWWVVLSRVKLIFLPLNRNHPAPIYFTVAVLLQSLHAFILSFNPLFYFDQKFYNTLAVLLIVISSHLFFLFGHGLYTTALEFDGKPLNNSDTKRAKIETVLFITAISTALLFEYFLGGKSNNLVTPSAVDILKDKYLMIGRLISFCYVIFCEWSLISYVYKIFSTTYGNRLTVQIRGWAGMLSTFFISVHYITNPLATLVIFLAPSGSFIGKAAKDLYVAIETKNGMPIVFFLLLATGPRWLINLLASLYINILFFVCSNRINTMRTLLIKEFPEIELGLNADNQRELSNKSTLTRSVVEISDGVNLLLRHISSAESNSITTVGKKLGKNPYQIESDILSKALTNKRDGLLMTSVPVTEIASQKAVSLTELVQCYYQIAGYLVHIPNKINN